MRQRRRADGRAADVRPGMTGEGPEPGFLRVEGLVAHHEAVLLDHLPNRLALAAREVEILVPDDDGGSEVPVADDIVPDLLEGAIDVAGLAGGGVVDEGRFFLRDRLLEQR